MNKKDLKQNTIKNKIKIVIMITVIFLSGIYTYRILEGNKKEEEIKINKKEVFKDKDKMIAIMYKDSTTEGKYKEWLSSNRWPDKYKYKLGENTGCLDIEGELIPNSIEYDTSKSNPEAKVTATGTIGCYLYFDELPQHTFTIRKNPTNGVSTIKYRINGEEKEPTTNSSVSFNVYEGSTVYFSGTANTGYTMNSDNPTSYKMLTYDYTVELKATPNNYPLNIVKGTGIDTIKVNYNKDQSSQPQYYSSSSLYTTATYGTQYSYCGYPNSCYNLSSCNCNSGYCYGTMDSTSGKSHTISGNVKTYTLSLNRSGSGVGTIYYKIGYYGTTYIYSSPITINCSSDNIYYWADPASSSYTINRCTASSPCSSPTSGNITDYITATYNASEEIIIEEEIIIDEGNGKCQLKIKKSGGIKKAYITPGGYLALGSKNNVNKNNNFQFTSKKFINNKNNIQLLEEIIEEEIIEEEIIEESVVTEITSFPTTLYYTCGTEVSVYATAKDGYYMTQCKKKKPCTTTVNNTSKAKVITVIAEEEEEDTGGGGSGESYVYQVFCSQGGRDYNAGWCIDGYGCCSGAVQVYVPYGTVLGYRQQVSSPGSHQSCVDETCYTAASNEPIVSYYWADSYTGTCAQGISCSW